MKISKKQRSWILGAALLLTVAATAAVNSQDDADIAVVHREKLKSTELVPHQPITSEPNQETEHLAVSDAPSDLLVDKLKRPALPESVKDMFPVKSWYVPPPPSKIIPPPVAPPLSYQYIGKMLEEGNHPAVFLEKQGRIFIVRVGDTVDSKYRVDTIVPPLMTFTYLPLNIKQTMQIGETN
jgi:hypothetical protein